ncbi:glycerophosphodiester phosphodiesterase [Anditalea andensis]|uniref:Glycerophosphodiester phosphodiesterase n=1 Tax=Anditalea andensis TaxID=1048983 RepID=A0A074KZF3_9BACT|nr:glycerophosphodiester phosphodiesterase family protein [Anditalea andensis]KEO75371.1 glycerophosphodiester phosphodiesterase [Anditalea andensis]
MKYFAISLILTFSNIFLSHPVHMVKDEAFHTNKIIAHRGAWKAKNLPQNSIASLEEAIRLGCEGSEFDVWMTMDSVLVVNHDADFYGMPIESSTYKALLEKKHPNGEQIPTVEKYLKKGMEQNGTKLIMELKTSTVSKERSLSLAKNAVKLVKDLGAEKWVDYIAFDYDMCEKIIAEDHNANVAYLYGNKSPEELKKAGFFGLDYHFSIFRKNPQWINEAHDLGLTVNAWTVNKEEDMQWLLDQQVRFISTDEPELLFKLINNSNLRM